MAWIKKTPCSPAAASQQLTIGGIIFTDEYIRELARNAGFTLRKSRKIDVCALLASLCEQCFQGSPSCNDLAAHIEANYGAAPSRQAINLRLNESFETLLQWLLEKIIAEKVDGKGFATPADVQFRGYRRVLVQDSTILKLPIHLFKDFSGVSNATSRVCNARIQATYDLINFRLLSFSIDPYSKNDLAAAPELLLREGDLVLRDRGYLVLDELQRHRNTGADCIYRHKTGTTYIDPQTLELIDLPALLKRHGSLDIDVLLNNASRTRVRLVAAPVSEEMANLRRMKAKKEACGHNPSEAVLYLMSWTIFITTIPADKADFKLILAIYGLRWRIEIIFKAWKSHMKFDLLHRVSKRQLAILLKTRLLVIAACANVLYNPLESSLWRRYKRKLSFLKFTNYLCKSPANFIRALRSLSATDEQSCQLLDALARYCCYDKRKRRNYSEIREDLA